MPDVIIRAMRDDPFPAEGYAERIENGHRDAQGVWWPLEGTYRIRDLSAGQHVLSLYEWEQRPRQRWLIVECALPSDTGKSTVFYYDWTSGTLEPIVTRRRSATIQTGSTFLTIGRWLYILTPEDTPVRFDGSRVQVVGWPIPPPPPIAVGPAEGYTAVDVAGSEAALVDVPNAFYLRDEAHQRGVGPFPTPDEGDKPWRYGYALTYLNALGQESQPSALAFASGTNRDADDGGRSLVYLTIPPGPPGSVAGRLWRTANLMGIDEPNNAEVYLIDEFSHVGGHQYIDHTPDYELVAALDDAAVGPPPSAPPTGAFWAGYFWLVNGEDRSRLHRSNALLHEQFAAQDYYEIGSAGSGDIVAVVPAQRALFIFKERGIYALNDPLGVPFELSTAHGTTAGKAIAVVPEVGLFYLDDRQGPSVIVGTLTDDQSTTIRALPGIRRTWHRQVGSRLASARVVYDAEYREVWWSVPEGGNVLNSLSLVFHLDGEGWSLRPDWPVDAMLVTASGHRIVGSREVREGIDLLTYGVSDRYDQGVPVELTVHTAWLETGQRTHYHVAELVVDAVGDGALVYVTSRSDRRRYDQDQTENGKPLRHPDHDRDVWGTATYSASEEWTEIDPARIPVDLEDRTEAYSYQLRLHGERLRLYALRVASEGEPRSPGERR